MALTESAARRTAAKSRRAEKRSRGLPKRQRLLIGLLAFLAIIGAGAFALWHPPLMQRFLTPYWTALGPAGILIPSWAATLYILARRDPHQAASWWRWWTGSFLAILAIEGLPNAVGGAAIGWVPFESAIGGAIAAEAGFIGILRVLVLTVASASFLFPRQVWKLTLASGRRARHGIAVGARRGWRALRRQPAVALAPAQNPPPLAPPAVPASKAKRASKAQQTVVDDNGPRIILPAQAAPDIEALAEPEPGVAPAAGEAGTAGVAPIAGDPTNPFEGLPQVRWRMPSIDLYAPEPVQQIDHDAFRETATAIRSTLLEYGIEAEVKEIYPGPTVTLYGIRPGWSRRFRDIREKDAAGNVTTRREETGKVRVKVDRISTLDKDLALQLKASSVRIEPQIPGTNLIGIEVPNPEPQLVVLRSLLQSEVFKHTKGRTKLAVPLGKGSSGEVLVSDLAKMPHLLIAGATGSGKSVFINVLITSILSNATPREVRFLMVDPKRVELIGYNEIPHLLTPVIVDTSKVVNALRWLTLQMEERLQVLSEAGVRDIASYNRKRSEAERMPYLVLIVDELADLMMTAGKAVEQGLIRLAQMGRATGIHLVVATQRPSVNVVTGLIKANFPTRISFMVTSQVDSRTILDGGGAEKLLGRGDMLYLPQEATRPRRIQGAYISEEEADEVVAFWRTQGGTYKPPELPELLSPEDLAPRGSVRTVSGGGSDDMMERARELAKTYNGRVSTSLLQRRLGVGYPRAARMRDLLVDEGLASPDVPNAPVENQGRSRRSDEEDAPF